VAATSSFLGRSVGLSTSPTASSIDETLASSGEGGDVIRMPEPVVSYVRQIEDDDPRAAGKYRRAIRPAIREAPVGDFSLMPAQPHVASLSRLTGEPSICNPPMQRPSER